MNSNKSLPIIATVSIVLILCLCCLCLAAAGIMVASSAFFTSQSDTFIETPLTDIWTSNPEPEATLDPQTIDLLPAELDQARDSLRILNENIVPINDPIDLVGRLGGKPNVSNVLIDENAP